MTWLPSTLASMASSRLVATGRSKRGDGLPGRSAPTERSPVVDMMEQADREEFRVMDHEGLRDHAAHATRRPHGSAPMPSSAEQSQRHRRPCPQ